MTRGNPAAIPRPVTFWGALDVFCMPRDVGVWTLMTCIRFGFFFSCVQHRPDPVWHGHGTWAWGHLFPLHYQYLYFCLERRAVSIDTLFGALFIVDGSVLGIVICMKTGRIDVG